MAVKIGVLAKQVLYPEMPMAAFRIDAESKKVVPPPNIPPVVNGFDENVGRWGSCENSEPDLIMRQTPHHLYM